MIGNIVRQRAVVMAVVWLDDLSGKNGRKCGGSGR